MFFTGRFILDFCSCLLSELSAKLLPEYLEIVSVHHFVKSAAYILMIGD